MVYAANCCRLNHEHFTILVFIILTQCGLLRCAPMILRGHHLAWTSSYQKDQNSDDFMVENLPSTAAALVAAIMQNNLTTSLPHTSTLSGATLEFDPHFIQTNVFLDLSHSKINGNNNNHDLDHPASNSNNDSRIHKNFRIKDKSNSSASENESILADLEINLINLDNKIFKTLTKATNKNQLKMKNKNSKNSKSNNSKANKNSLVNEINVNRIIHHNDFVDFFPNRPVQIESNEILRIPSQLEPNEEDTHFEIISNSIENDDFYFTDTTTTTTTESTTTDNSLLVDDTNLATKSLSTNWATEKTDTVKIETEEVPIEPTPPVQSSPIIPSKTTGLSVNYTIPFHIPFEFYDSTSPISIDETIMVAETPASTVSTLKIDTIETSLNSTVSIDLSVNEPTTILDQNNAPTSQEKIFEELDTTIWPELETKLSSVNDSALSDNTESSSFWTHTTTTNTLMTELNKQKELNESELPIKIGDDQIISSVITTSFPQILTSSSVDTNTTKSIPYPDNPQFLECISSCGTDHDCVRTKCLLDSTYFG